MKRLTLVIMPSLLFLLLGSSLTLAKEEKLSLTAEASSFYYRYYTADKAVDGNDSTFWVGGVNRSPWWIMFDAGGRKKISKVNIKWYNHSYYTPSSYDIQISDDGETWEDIYTDISGIYSMDGETRQIDREARYIRLYIRTVQHYFPVLREFSAYSSIDLPRTIRFQGMLKDAQEIPLNETVALTFRLYTTEAGGSPIWEETLEDITVKDGMLDVELGGKNHLDLLFDRQYYLGVEVESDGEMTPRFKLTTVPYAIRSEE